MSRRRSWVKCICKGCGREFEIVPYRIKQGRGKFCSRKCYQRWNKGLNNSQWRGLTQNCEVCGKVFAVKRSQAMAGKGRFCSRQCQSVWQSETKGRRSKPSRGEAISESKPNKKTKKTSEICRIPKVCEECGKKFEIIPSEAKRGGGRFCSRECMNHYQCGPNHPQWRGGKGKRPSDKKQYPNKKPRVRKSRPGLIYFLLADNGLYKIGRTKNLRKRIKDLGVKLPYDLKLEIVIKTEDMYWLETELHQRFSENQVRGEWFQLNESDLEYIRKFALSMVN